MTSWARYELLKDKIHHLPVMVSTVRCINNGMITHGTFLHQSCDFYSLRALQSSLHGTKAVGTPQQRDMRSSGHTVISFS